MRRKKLLTLVGSVCLILVLAALPFMAACPAPPPEKEYIIRFACEFPTVSTLAKLMPDTVEKLAQESNGRIKLEAYWGGSLYSQADALAAMQDGSLEAGMGGMFLFPVSPEWCAILTTPFLFTDRAHFERFTETDAFKAMQDRVEAKGIMPIANMGTFAFYPANNKRPIATLEDWKGLKMRFPSSPGFKLMADIFDFTVVPIAPPETISALETGVIDGTVISMESWPGYRAQELAPYVNKMALQWVRADLVVSKQWFDSLPPDIQQIVKRAFEELGAENERITLEAEREMWVKLAEYPKVVITEPTPAEKVRWFEAAKPIKEAAAAASPDIAAMIEGIDSVR